MHTQIQPIHFLLILLFCGVQFFLSLGDLGFVGPDEPRYAQVAKEMLVSGDYVTPQYFGEPWLEKPSLYYWLTATAYFLFGISEFSARLASALAATLGVLCVYLLGSRRSQPREGLIASLILATSMLYFSLARAGSMDMLFCSALTVSWTSLFFIIFGKNRLWTDSSTNQTHWGLLALFYIFLGVAVLAKGPLGLILPVGSLVILLGFTGKLYLLSKLKPFTGLLIVVVVALPWYWLCYQANGWVFIEEFLLQHNLERFFTDRYQHAQPMWFFLVVVLVGFYPWSFQMFPAVWRLFRVRNSWKSSSVGENLYLWLWFLIPMIFFSLSHSKLPGYLLPAAPAIALIIAREIELWLNRKPSDVRRIWLKDVFFYQAFTVFLVGLVLPFEVDKLNLPVHSFILQTTSLLVGTGLIALLLYWRNHRRCLVACYVLALSLSVFFVTQQAFPRVDATQSSRQLAMFLQQQGLVNQRVFVFGISRNVAYGLSYYLNTKVEIIYSEGEMFYSPGTEAFFITFPSFCAETFFSQTKVRQIADFESLQLLRVVRPL